MAEEGQSTAAEKSMAAVGHSTAEAGWPTEGDGDSRVEGGQLTAGAVSPIAAADGRPRQRTNHFEGTKRPRGGGCGGGRYFDGRYFDGGYSGGGGYYDGRYIGGRNYGGDVYAPTAYEPTPVYLSPTRGQTRYRVQLPVAPATTVVTPAVTYESLILNGHLPGRPCGHSSATAQPILL
jgi:hypothetical protein